MSLHRSNFVHLARMQADLALLGAAAERYFADDPNTSLLKLRQFGELMAQQVAARAGIYTPGEDSQAALLARLKGAGWLAQDVADLFHWLRKAGNEANHRFVANHRAALQGLKVATQLGFWFHRSFGNADFKGGAFTPPAPPADETAAFKAELAELREKSQAEVDRAQTAQQQAIEAKEEAKLWEALAEDGSQAVGVLEAKLNKLQAESAAQLAELQAQAVATPQGDIVKLQKRADHAASFIQLDEKATRELIDQQLRDAGWEARMPRSREAVPHAAQWVRPVSCSASPRVSNLR